MILHCVFCNFQDEITLTQRTSIFEELRSFSQNLDDVLAFDSGPNRDFENKSPNFSDGFVIHFRDQQALENYAVHPTHQQLGSRLCDLCKGGADGIMVFDIETNS